MSKNKRNKNIGAIIGGAVGSASLMGSSAFSLSCSDATLENACTGDGLDETSSEVSNQVETSTDLADGNTLLLATVSGTFSGAISASTSSREVWVIDTKDQKVYSEVEERANKIYDKYNSNHISEKKEGATLIADDPEIANLLRAIVKETSKTELIMAIEEIEKILNNNNGPQLVRNKHDK